MHRVFKRRPSGAMLTALLALVISTSGTAIAAGGLTAGDKLIKKDSLSGNRLRAHTVTGQEIKLSKLGTVPRAALANVANSAATATTATTATDANHASSADTATTASTATNANHASSADTATSATTVNGQQVVSLFTAVTAGSAAQQFMNLGGVTISVGCSSGPHAPSMTISNTTSPAQAARINIEAVQAGGTTYETQGDFSSTSMLNPGVSAGTGEANAVFADGRVVTVYYSFENNAQGVFGDCTFSGHAIAG